MRSALHITNGDSAAGMMKKAGLGGEILPWRDVLHDGPVPDLGLSELGGVRAGYLASIGFGDSHEIALQFAQRDAMLSRFAEFDKVVLWFEWDLYDQLQLIQILDFFAERQSALAESGTSLDIVSVAGYLGRLEAADFPPLFAERKPVTPDILARGAAAWQSFTSDDPRNIAALIDGGGSALPFLDTALIRLLEELPWSGDGLARSERQLLNGLGDGASTFGDAFVRASEMEERVYCGDSSAETYIRRLSAGPNPLVSSNGKDMLDAELSLTEKGKMVLAGKGDWITLGGSDRWLGGVHLDGENARWRWDAATRSVIESRAA